MKKRETAKTGRGRAWMMMGLAVAVGLAAPFLVATDAGAAAKRSARAIAAAAPSAGCLGPFTEEETKLYADLAAARERVEAAEAALAIRERLFATRELRLTAQMEELVRLEERIEARMIQLETDEKRLYRLADDLAEREDVQAPPPAAPSADVGKARTMNAAQLAVMVRSMKPEAAGQLLTQLPSGLSTEVLSRLPARQAGRILGSMDPDAASGLSVAFIHRQPATPAAEGGGGGTP